MLFRSPSHDTASANYRNRKLKLEETNLVSGYYQQDGEHSAITGGVGTQQLTDVSNVIQLRFVKWDARERKKSFDAEFGLDHHTSASMAWISKTGASNTGSTRIYPSLNWKTEDESKGRTIGWGLALSNEYHYKSLGANLNFAILSVGIGFFTGKVSWGLMIGVAAGIAGMFGAPTIVAAITGTDKFTCGKTSY